MAIDDLRQRMESWWSNFDSDALARKDSQAVALELIKLYGLLDAPERISADQIIGEWARSEQERKRFDAIALIDHFQVRSAVPHLRALERDLQEKQDPAASFELKKVESVLQRLESE